MEDKSKIFDDIIASRAFLKSLPTRKQPSAATVRQYQATFRRLVESGKTPLDYANTKSSYYSYRAAWCYCAQELSEKYLKKADKEKDWEIKLEYVRKLKDSIVLLRNVMPDPDGKNFAAYERGEYSSEWRRADKPKTKSKSKKRQVPHLPKNWQQRIFDHLSNLGRCTPEKSKYLNAVCVLALAGVRPAELRKGITVSRDGDMLHFVIQGAKTKGGTQGQVERSFSVKADCDHFKCLWQQTRFFPITVQIESEKNLCEQMRKYSERLFPNLSSKISSYTYRHNFASVVKAVLTPVGTATVLGHSNDKSQRYYSNAKKSSGSFVIDNINGTSRIKCVSKPNTSYMIASPSQRPAM